MTSSSKWSDLISGEPGKAVAAANQLLPFWVSLVLVVLIAWKLSSIVWSLVPGPAAGVTIVPPAGSVQRSSAGSADVTAIAAASLFGKADPMDAVEAEPVLVVGPDLEETNINMTLKGTIASDQDAMSAAIISLGSDDEQVFTIGESVASGASLHAVYTDRVVLNENGKLTALYLPEETVVAGRTQRRAPVRRQAPAIQPAAESIQSVVASNVAKLSDVIRPTPYFVDGQQAGYRVYPGRDRSKFSALGLRAGDLIQEIDGQSLTDPGQAMQIFQSLGDATQVTVTIERNGQPESLILNTEQLSIDGAEEEGINE